MGVRKHSKEWKQGTLQLAQMLDGPLRLKMSRVVEKALIDECKRFQQLINSMKEPVYTGNLRDSTGVAFYHSGRVLTTFYPPKTATVTQRYKKWKKIDGQYEGLLARKEGARMFSKGYGLLLFSAVPYADAVNSGAFPNRKSFFRYFDFLSNFFTEDIRTNLIIALNKAATSKAKK